MPKIDTSIWNSPKRMRDRIKNLATMVLVSCVIGLYPAIGDKNWIIVAILGLNIFSVLPVFVSYTKWQKNPPVEVLNEL